MQKSGDSMGLGGLRKTNQEEKNTFWKPVVGKEIVLDTVIV